MTKKIFQVCAGVLCLSVALVVGCSSSDSPDSTADQSGNQDTLLTGAFIDSPVAGLRYISSSGITGMTNAAGEFQYLAGESVSFFLGALKLGEIAGAEKITPFDLVGFELEGENLSVTDLAQDIVAAEVTGNVTNFEQGINMLILLQSLDRNNNPGDGIDIAADVFQFFLTAFISLVFNVDTKDFLVEFLKIFVTLITDGLLLRDGDATPVDRDDALEHFLLGT